jgi:hypothetical protein
VVRGASSNTAQTASGVIAERRLSRSEHASPDCRARLGLHGITAQMMVVDPNTVRMKERTAKGKFSINSVKLAPANKTIAMGRKAIEFRAGLTVQAIRKEVGQ